MTMINLNHNTIISFSGGMSSAYMLKLIIDKYGSLPKNSRVIFCNTGKEMPETLEFVQECSLQWNIDVIWLELYDVIKKEDKKDIKDWIFKYKITDYKNCAKKGEPFEKLIKHYGKLPNATNRFCTYLLKKRAIEWWEKENDFKNADHILGLRYDEQRRVSNIINRDDNRDYFCPLHYLKKTRFDVYDFWKKQDFKLKLVNNNKHTLFGNCDMCFLKGKGQLVGMMREQPKLADWWIKQERKTGKTFKFDTDFKAILNHSKKPDLLSILQSESSVDCFCTD